jgi:uncharacterized protein YjbI with pentapeptide repeats
LLNDAQSRRDQQREDRRATQQQRSAIDAERENTLRTYLAQISDLMLERHLLRSQPRADVREVARTATLTAARRLDGPRRGVVIRFLAEARLLQNRGRTGVPLRIASADLRKADLSGADLSGAHLNRADLRDADLEGAHLSRAVLDRADLNHAVLRGAVLPGTGLIEVHLKEATLHGANLRGANLFLAQLNHAVLRGAVLPGADLRGAYLDEADLRRADLRRADLSGNFSGMLKLMRQLYGRVVLRRLDLPRAADLSTADLRGADLRGADLRKALLLGADLGGAALRGALVLGVDLGGARGVNLKSVRGKPARGP